MGCVQTFLTDAFKKQALPVVSIVSLSFNGFPMFDSFVAYGSQNSDFVCHGYQSRTGNKLPKATVPNWIKKGYMFGDGTQPSLRKQLLWTYLTKSAIQEFLGASLAALYPADWGRMWESQRRLKTSPLPFKSQGTSTLKVPIANEPVSTSGSSEGSFKSTTNTVARIPSDSNSSGGSSDDDSCCACNSDN